MTNPYPDGNGWAAPTAAPPGGPGVRPGGSGGGPGGPGGGPGGPGGPWGAPGASGPSPGAPTGALVYGSPYAAPPPQPPQVRGPLATSHDVLAAVVAAAAMLVAGVPMGLLWGATAPRVSVTDLLQNSSETALEAQPASDARFALLGIVFGVVGGAIAAWRGRRAGWPLPVGLALGGLGGSLVAAQTGHMSASADALAGVPPTARAVVRDLVDVSVRAGGVHAAYPLAALLVFLVVALVTIRADAPTSRATTPPSHPFGVGQPGPSGPTAAQPWAAHSGAAQPEGAQPSSSPPSSPPPGAPPPDAWWSAPR